MEEMNNNLKENNSQKNNTVLIIILVLIIIALGGFIVYDKVLKKHDSEPKTNVTDKKDSENTNQDKDKESEEKNNTKNENKIEEITVDKTTVDKQLEEYKLPLSYAFEKIKYGVNLNYNQELLDSEAKLNFAWGVAEIERLGKYIPEDDVNPDLGNYYIDYDSFKTLYKRLFGEEFDGNLATTIRTYTLQGKILYGIVYTGFFADETYITPNKVVKEGNKYTITIDVYDGATKAKKESQLKIVAEKIGNDYQFKSIMLVK